jgi:hypothetical protein
MKSRKLWQLTAQVARFLDEPITESPSARHTVSNAHASINAAIERYALLMADAGAGAEARATLTTSASSTVTAGFAANEQVALPADLMVLLSASILVGSEWRDLFPFEEAERHDFATSYGSGVGLPMYYRQGTDNTGALVLRLMPAADQAYSVRVTYLVSPTELVNDDDTYSFLEGTSEWVELEAAIDMLGEDGNPEPQQVQLWRAKQQQSERRILQWGAKGMPKRRADTYGRRLASGQRGRGTWQ